jgi:hypothetical protein
MPEGLSSIGEADIFYQGKEEPIKSCLLILRDVILDQDPDMSETKKYGMPCFSYKDKTFVYLWTDKKRNDEPYILFVEGRRLDHPELETGNRKRMKIFRVNPHLEIPIDTIGLLLNQAMDLCRKSMD